MEPLLTHWGAKWPAKLELKRLKDFQKYRLINEEDAGKLKERIAKRAVAGGPRPVRIRPPTYRKPRPPTPPPSEPSGPSGPSDSAGPQPDNVARGSLHRCPM
jgi:hypothetical protein